MIAEKYRDNPLVIHSIEFSLQIIKYAQNLENKNKYVIAKQLLKSGTSIGANIMEAQSAQSRADFIHKLKVSDKEAHETLYWLYLCEHSEGFDFDTQLTSKLSEIMKLLNSIIKNTKINS
jgi:four helix bundle protein